jgi:uncharacterized protein involved in outer membrane biogenesis
MKKLLIFAGIVVVVIVAAAVLMVGNINTIVQKSVEKGGPILLKAPVSLNTVDIDIKSGAGQFKGLTIGNPDGYNTAYAFRLGNLKIDLDVKSVTSDKIHIKKIIIDGPEIIFEQKIGGKSNLDQLQENIKSLSSSGSKDEKSGSGSQGKKMQIDYVKVENANINVSMDVLQGKKLTVPIRPFELKNIGKNKDRTVADAMGILLKELNRAVLPAVTQAASGYQKMLQRKAGSVQEDAKKQLEGVKGLLK